MTEKGFGYLDKNLRPWIEKVSPVTDQSDISGFLGGDPLFVSQHSCRIRVGNNIEHFWNNVISSTTTNLIEDSNRTVAKGKDRQVDHLFMSKLLEKIYLEAKCNLNLDSQKAPASIKGVIELAEHYGTIPRFLVPVRRIPQQKHITKYGKFGIEVVGVEWISKRIDLPFTVDEYFEYGKTVLGDIMRDKGLVI